MADTLEIFALGSCRLIAPMHNLSRRNEITFTNVAQCWYAHSAAEMLQRLDHIEGVKTLPDSVLPDVLNIDSCATPPTTPPDIARLPDIGIFEISTRNSFWRDGYILHSTLVRKNNIQGVQAKVVNFDELSKNIIALSERFKKLVITCNIVYAADLKRADPNRLQLNYFLKGVGHNNPGITVLDPNELINPVSPENDLDDQNHFKPHMANRVSQMYNSVFKKL